MTIDAATGQTTPATTPVKIPDVKAWERPTTVVQGKPASTTVAGSQKALVTYVEDGDTANLKLGNGTAVNCRFDMIDAPETAHPKAGKAGQPYGEESKKTLQDMILNKEVTVNITQPKKGANYDRAVCQIEVSGKDVNLEMVKQGAAWALMTYGSDVMKMQSYNRAEAEAKANRRGLFQGINPQNPAQFRKDQRTTAK